MPPIIPRDGRLTTPTTALDIHYRDWDAVSTGEARRTPVLLLHGLASTCTIYDLCAPLLARTHRAVAYDQRGHGQTAKPEDGYEMPTFVADGVGLARALRIEAPYLVVGHSWGASVALHWALLHPELVSAVVLVDGVFNPWRRVTGLTWEAAAERLAPPDLSSMTLDDLVERMRGGLGFLDDAFRRAYAGALMEVTPSGSIRARLPRDKHMRILRTLWDEDVDAAITALHRPALALLAERTPGDDEVRRLQEARRQMVERLQRAQPLLRVRWLPDTIHDVPLQRPEVLAKAIDAMDS